MLEWQLAVLRMGETIGRMDRAYGIIAEILEVRRGYWLGLLARLAAPLFLLHVSPLLLNAPIWAAAGAAAYLSSVVKVLLKIDLPLLALIVVWPWIGGGAFFDRFRRFDAKHRFCVCLSALVRAGTPLAEAISIASAAVGSVPPAGWEKEETFVDRLSKLRVFSGDELGLLRVAEFSGTIDSALALLADRIREDWIASLRRA